MAGQIRSKIKEFDGPQGRGYRKRTGSHTFYGRCFDFFWPSFVDAPVALMRAARDGSVPSVTLTVIPGFKSAMLAR